MRQRNHPLVEKSRDCHIQSRSCKAIIRERMKKMRTKADETGKGDV